MWQKFETQSRELRTPPGYGFPCIVFLLLAWAAGPIRAQDGTDSAALPKGGLQIRSVSVNGVYYSNGLSLDIGTFQPGLVNATPDLGAGANIVLEWTRFTERSTFSLTYSPSYIGRVRYTSLDALNQAFSLNLSRKLASRWHFGFSAAADISNLGGYLFSPTTLGNVASVPANFEDLTAALLTSKFTGNPQLGVTLTNSPLVESPLRVLVYGQRMLTASAQASLSYSLSPRLAVSFKGGADRTQHLSDPQVPGGTSFYLIPATTLESASIGISYSLSPATQVGGSISTDRVRYGSQNFYTTTSVGTWGRALGRHWLLQLLGGVGVTTFVAPSLNTFPTEPHPIVSGTLIYKTGEHTLMGSYARRTSDEYGFGASTTSSADATWRWGRHGRPWWVESNFGWQQLYGSGVSNISGWRVTAALNQRLTPHLVLRTQYAYLGFGGGLQMAGSHFSQNAVRFEVTWISRPVVLR
jgi:hypothetical protein